MVCALVPFKLFAVTAKRLFSSSLSLSQSPSLPSSIYCVCRCQTRKAKPIHSLNSKRHFQPIHESTLKPLVDEGIVIYRCVCVVIYVATISQMIREIFVDIPESCSALECVPLPNNTNNTVPPKRIPHLPGEIIYLQLQTTLPCLY